MVQDCFASAAKEQPENAIYKKGLDMTKRAPELYDEIQKQMYPTKMRPQSRESFWFDVLGYCTIFGAIMAVSLIVGKMQTSGPAAPQPKSS